jgi:hypothetical protein
MARPEMHAVSTITGLNAALQWLRQPFYGDDALAWQRFMLTARCMWFAFKGKLPCNPATNTTTANDTGVTPEKDTGVINDTGITAETDAIAAEITMADAIIARARGGRRP